MSLVSILLLIATAVSTATQEQDYLRERVEQEFEQMRQAGRQAFQGVLSYPEDIRQAVLELGSHPDLVVKLVTIKEQTLDETIVRPSTVFEPYPKEAQDAGKLLLSYPDVLRIMKDHLAITSIVGQVYQQDKQKVLQMVNQIAQKTQQEYEDAVDSWAGQLEENPQAADNMVDALKAYRDQLPRDEKLSVLAGAELSDTNDVDVSGLPDVNFVAYILDNSRQYPDLTEQLLEYYEDYYDDDYYDDYYGYPVYHPYYYRPRPVLDEIWDRIKDRPVDSLPEGDVVERLRERQLFEQEFAEARQAREDLNRGQFARQNAERFPEIAERIDTSRIEPQLDEKSLRDEPLGTQAQQRDIARAREQLKEATEEREKQRDAVGNRAQQREKEREMAEQRLRQREKTREAYEKRARINRQKAERDEQIARAQKDHKENWQRSTARERVRPSRTRRSSPSRRR